MSKQISILKKEEEVVSEEESIEDEDTDTETLVAEDSDIDFHTAGSGEELSDYELTAYERMPRWTPRRPTRQEREQQRTRAYELLVTIIICFGALIAFIWADFHHKANQATEKSCLENLQKIQAATRLSN